MSLLLLPSHTWLACRRSNVIFTRASPLTLLQGRQAPSRRNSDILLEYFPSSCEMRAFGFTVAWQSSHGDHELSCVAFTSPSRIWPFGSCNLSLTCCLYRLWTQKQREDKDSEIRWVCSMPEKERDSARLCNAILLLCWHSISILMAAPTRSRQVEAEQSSISHGSRVPFRMATILNIDFHFWNAGL